MSITVLLTRLQYSTRYKLVSCTLLLAVADILFYNHDAGWTLGLFCLLLLLAMGLHNRVGSLRDVTLFAAASGLALSFVESPTTLGVLMFSVTAIAFAINTRIKTVDDVRIMACMVLRYVFCGWWRLQRDSVILGHIRKRLQKGDGSRSAFIRNWLLPLGLSTIFIWLFAEANPIITQWVARIDWNLMSEYISLPRFCFWVFTASGCWALIRPRRKALRQRLAHTGSGEFTLTSLIFNERSIFTSLVMFNLLFLIENALDIAFIWGGMALPEGVSYAEYAHQGAYPLIATALLAALFVLIALKPGSATENMLSIRVLVYAWVGQNVFLVCSSILRLMGYVQQYSLTWLRVEAFIWMGLVALGLVLIVARIYLQKSNRWLINCNAAALYATLYICCFVNFGGMIAEYNLDGCNRKWDSGYNSLCDIQYLSREVGVEALPALLRFEQGLNSGETISQAMQARRELAFVLRGAMQDWRQWTLRNWRIALQTPATATQ